MARVLALIPDLLFGSRVQGALTDAGHEVQLLPDQARLSARLAERATPPVDVLVVDLTGGELDASGVLEALPAAGARGGPRTLACYAHVDASMRERAQLAGFDLVVPRSRMAREGAALVAGLAVGGEPG